MDGRAPAEAYRPPGVRAADPESILELQRTAGNRAVVGLVTGPVTTVQRAPGDPAPGHAADADTLQGGTRPDARARARAADYTAVYADWVTLGPTGRQQRIADIINAHLAREGIPPVRVAYGSMAAGAAQFSSALWSMSVSRADVEADHLSPTAFATLVESAVHETQHTVTTFRGVRVALARGVFDDRSYLRDGIANEARAANKRRDPAKELSEHAADEAFEIYRISVDPVRAVATNVGHGEVSRETVLARKQAADLTVALATNKIREAKNATERAAAEAAYAAAAQEHTAAHNAYMALPEETFSWRAGKAARAAVLERIELQDRLQAARTRAFEASRAQRTARAGADPTVTSAAFQASQLAEREVRAARQQLEGLTRTEPRMVGGRREMRDVPLTKAEIAKAPKAPPVETTDVEAKAAPAGAPRPAELSPLPARIVPGAPLPAPPKAGGYTRKVVDAPGGGIGTEWVKEAPDTGNGKRSEKAGGVVVGGDQLVGLGGRSSETSTVDGVSTTVNTRAGVGLTKEGLEAKAGRTVEVVHGTDASGRPITSTRATTGSATLTDQGVAVKTGLASTNQAGTTRHVSGGATFDDKGVAVEAGAGLTGKSGTGVTVTMRAGHQVEAGEPVEVAPGVFEVSYAVTDSRNLGAGGSASRTSAGPSLGGGVGTSSATSQTGVRRFTSKSEAQRFAKHAALMIELGGRSAAPATALGALAIPIGESRGSGEMEGTNWNVSASYGASLSYGEQKSTTHQLSVRRTAERLVEVTAVVSSDKIKDLSISGGITNTKGTSATSAWAMTFRFDLGTTAGRGAYELYVATRMPPLSGGTLVSMTESSGAGEHDKVGVGPLGSAQWTGRTFESKTTTDQGVSQVFGGEKAHDQTPGRVGRWLGEDELHSSATLTARLDNGRAAGFDAQIKVKSDSGEYNREQFGEIFQGAQAGKANAKPSGEWTLTANIKPAVIRELERISDKFRNARTPEERMRVLATMYKKGGAQAAGGLVRWGGDFKHAWSLELKGDENFPGVAGRQRLDEQHHRLDATLLSTPDAADAVVREAKEAMTKLEARRQQVGRPDKYTDLPTELREQQLALIDKHLKDFRAVHERALKQSVKTVRGESADAARTRDSAGGLQPGQRESDQLRDRSVVLQDDIDTTGKAISDASKALHRGAQSVAQGVTSKHLSEQTTSFKGHIATAYSLDRRQAALKATADGLREAWHNEGDPAARLIRLKSLVTALDERLKLLLIQLFTCRQAAAAIKPVTTEAAMAANPAFWADISGDELSDE